MLYAYIIGEDRYVVEKCDTINQALVFIGLDKSVVNHEIAKTHYLITPEELNNDQIQNIRFFNEIKVDQ